MSGEPSLAEQLRAEVDEASAEVIDVAIIFAAADRLEALEAVVNAQEAYMAGQRVGRMSGATIDRLTRAKANLAALNPEVSP